MRIDFRKNIKNSFLYKRFAYYQSEGFVELMKFLENENLIDDFCEECDFNKESLINDLEFNKKEISLWEFLQNKSYSFSFEESRKGFEFWYYKFFENEDFNKIEDKLL